MKRMTADAWAAQALVAASALELSTRDAYFRFADESAAIVFCVVVWFVITVLAFTTQKWENGFAALSGGKLAVWIAAAFTFQTLFSGALAAALVASGGTVALWIAAIAAACWAASLAVTPLAWERLKGALAAASLAFVGSQWILSALVAHEISWPGSARIQGGEGNSSTMTIVVLFDELNANAAHPIVAALEEQGYKTSFGRIMPVADGTAKVIPALFTGRPFPDPKPCSTTAICSGEQVLDFSKVNASRNDLDIVGFYHPYCAIRGLRSCVRGEASSVIFDSDRWRCASWRRIGWPRVPIRECDVVYARSWSRFVEDTIAAIWRAPVWTRGGVLYAHLPLPHPPGALASGSLERDYLSSVKRAASVTSEMAKRARASGFTVRFIVFSDHPLRQSSWCASYAPYALRGCVPIDSLRDVDVPLIVAGDTLPNVSDIKSNSEVFRLLDR